jgi:hypothetical protein
LVDAALRCARWRTSGLICHTALPQAANPCAAAGANVPAVAAI